jgi:hypothetical protein
MADFSGHIKYISAMFSKFVVSKHTYVIRKFSYLSVIIATAIFSSCKEKGPIIDLGQHTAKDSTYVAAVETPQQHMMLVEEFTGASCSNCPKAHETLNSLQTQYPNRMAIMALHIFNFNQSEPYNDGTYVSTHDFRTQVGTDIGNTVYGGVSSMPVGGFDRLDGIGGGIINPPTDNLVIYLSWPSVVAHLLDSVPAVNLSVSSSLNAAGDTAYITVKAAYTKAVTAKNVLSVAITESNLLDFQEDPDAPNGSCDVDYNFKDVLRDFVSPTLGSPVLDSLSIKGAGRVFKRSFVYKVNPDWKPENCKVVAFISNAETGDKHVLQAAVTNLKQ